MTSKSHIRKLNSLISQVENNLGISEEERNRSLRALWNAKRREATPPDSFNLVPKEG